MNREKIFETLKQHVPSNALHYCYDLWLASPFALKITKSRQSKVGDFTSLPPRNGKLRTPRITLNQDLNRYLFLVTYIHEVAHLHVYLKYKNSMDPHGDEWKNAFKYLMAPVLNASVFPGELLSILQAHMVNPKASSFADVELTKAFRQFDEHAKSFSALSDIPEGSIFLFQDRYFQKGKLKRTRVLCREVKTKKNYLIPSEVLVSNVQLSLLQ